MTIKLLNVVKNKRYIKKYVYIHVKRVCYAVTWYTIRNGMTYKML